MEVDKDRVFCDVDILERPWVTCDNARGFAFAEVALDRQAIRKKKTAVWTCLFTGPASSAPLLGNIEDGEVLVVLNGFCGASIGAGMLPALFANHGDEDRPNLVF